MSTGKYIVSSTTTIKNAKTGQRFTSTHYFMHWILGEGCGMSLDSIDKAKRMTFAQARKVAKYRPDCTIERAPETISK
jgi:hypothetical protein